MSIDLHIHSNFSDGIYKPEKITELAFKNKLKAFSLTDHDTIAGLKCAKNKALELNIEFVPGVEISAKWQHGMLHVLGYYINPESEILINGLAEMRKKRQKRNPKIIRKLNELGIKITLDEVKQNSNGGVTGRPDIARALVKKKYAENIRHAFSLYLDKGKSAYVEKEKMLPEQACEIINKSNGIAVIAHPFTLGLEGQELFNAVKKLKQAGFMGIEAIYPELKIEQKNFFIDIAKQLDMFITGGSDFHDREKPEIYPGCVKVDYNYLKQIKNFLDVE